MNTQLHQRCLVIGLAFVTLTACNSNETKPDESKPTISANAEFNKPSEQVVTPKPAAEIKNPTVINFDKLSIALDNAAREQIAQITERAKATRKLSVTGYCDKGQVGNPSDVAVARAVAVRDEMVKLGVPASSILVKFVTKVSKKHAAEIKFD